MIKQIILAIIVVTFDAMVYSNYYW